MAIDVIGVFSIWRFKNAEKRPRHGKNSKNHGYEAVDWMGYGEE
jgi:hypothetical protein